MQGFDSTCISPGPKSELACTRGIAAGLMSTQGPFSTAPARTQFHLVQTKWRKEGYSVIRTISFAALIVAFILFFVIFSRTVHTKASRSEWLQHRWLNCGQAHHVDGWIPGGGVHIFVGSIALRVQYKKPLFSIWSSSSKATSIMVLSVPTLFSSTKCS
ncbi:hypothetical protein MRX96_012379 [Rhipicephalus microplus]